MHDVRNVHSGRVTCRYLSLRPASAVTFGFAVMLVLALRPMLRITVTSFLTLRPNGQSSSFIVYWATPLYPCHPLCALLLRVPVAHQSPWRRRSRCPTTQDDQRTATLCSTRLSDDSRADRLLEERRSIRLLYCFFRLLLLCELDERVALSCEESPRWQSARVPETR